MIWSNVAKASGFDVEARRNSGVRDNAKRPNWKHRAKVPALEAAAAKMAKEKEEKAKAEAEKRAKALKKANIDMELENKWARQIFEAGWEGHPSGDSFNRCFETMWCN